MPNPLLVKLLIFTVSGFILALLLQPFWFKFLIRSGLGKHIRDDGSTPIFHKLHAKKKNTPTMGGVLIWGTLSIIVSFFWILHRSFSLENFAWLNIITRKDTLLPWGAFLGASLVGLLDDFLDIRRMGHNGQGLRFRVKIIFYAIVAGIGAWWFYFKLEHSSVFVPFIGELSLGWMFIAFFLLVCLGTSFAVNQTDGLDGLSGGTLLISFMSYTVIAYFQGRDNLSAFIGLLCGAILAFLWFNIYPARFFMGDTGSMGLGVLLAIIAFLTKTEFLLPLIGIVFVIEAISTLLQLFSKKCFKRKIFLVAPIHHHFEAKGWPETQVTMRFWIIQAIGAISGLIIFFVAYPH